MRLGGTINLATMRGQFPHVRHCARMRLSRTQSGSVSSPIACRAPMPTTAASTYAAQSPERGPNAAGNFVTFGIHAPDQHAPRRPRVRYSTAKMRMCKQFLVSFRFVNHPSAHDFHDPLKYNQNSPVALIGPPVCATCGAEAVGLMPDRSRETCQRRGCRLASDFGLAPELRRRLWALEPGRRAPAGSRHRILYRRQDPRVRLQLHVLAPSRQVQQ